MDHSLPGSSVHGMLQARILEWAAVPSSRGSSRPRGRACVSHAAGPLSPVPPGKPGLSLQLCNLGKERVPSETLLENGNDDNMTSIEWLAQDKCEEINKTGKNQSQSPQSRVSFLTGLSPAVSPDQTFHLRIYT